MDADERFGRTVMWDPNEKIEFETGAIRSDKNGRGRFDLLPFDALTRLAKIFEEGGKQKGNRNWEQGFPMWSLIDSTIRHLAKYMMGWVDEDHLAMACWNLICALATDDRIRNRQFSHQVSPKLIEDLPQKLKENFEECIK